MSEVGVYRYGDVWCVICTCGHWVTRPTRFEADQHAHSHQRIHDTEREEIA